MPEPVPRPERRPPGPTPAGSRTSCSPVGPPFEVARSPGANRRPAARTAAALVAGLLTASACGGEARESRPTPAAKAAQPAPADAGPATEVTISDPFAGARSLRLTRSTGVHAGPGIESGRFGTIARDTRVAYRRVAPGPGCDRVWVQIEPRGWVCGSNFEASPRAPFGVELPKVPRNELVPGIYGKVVAARNAPRPPPRPDDQAVAGTDTEANPEVGTETDTEAEADTEADSDTEADTDTEAGPNNDVAVVDRALVWTDVADPAARAVKRRLSGAVTVRRYGEVVVDGVTYWRIGRNEYVDARGIRPHAPSTWAGLRLADATGRHLPLGFALEAPARRRHRAIAITASPGGRRVGALSPRQAVPILETRRDASGAAIAHRIGDGQWVDARHVRVARQQARPPGVGPSERWVDVDLDEQLVVAYEGDLAVYATLMSSGSSKHPSRTGIFRIWLKFAETDMTGGMAGDGDGRDADDSGAYSVATVPWTQFYFKDLAFHTAYWHDDFGAPRSHGCLNLSPIDARWLYFFTEPGVPPGWSMAHGSVTYPGSVVRVRSADDPAPDFVGYAERVHQARAAR